MMELWTTYLHTPWFLGAVGSVILLVLATVIILHLRKTRDERHLQKLLKVHAQEVVKDAVIPDGLDGFLFADYLILHHGKVMVLNVKHKRGYVFGGEKIDEWSSVENNKTEKFHNPLVNVKMFAQAITHALNFPDVQAYVLFDSQSYFAR